MAGGATAAAAGFAYLEDEEVVSESKIWSGYFHGWEYFDVDSYYRIRKRAECPWRWDIDFVIDSDGDIDTADVKDSYPNTLPGGDENQNFDPDPNTWDDWSDQEQESGEGHKAGIGN